MAKYGEKFLKCPVFTAQSLIGGKWKVYILWMLHDGAKRFSEINRSLPHVTQSMLTNTLRDLEKDGLVHREVYREVPPRVEYSLTPIARKLIPSLEQLVEWGIEYMSHMGTMDEEAAKPDLLRRNSAKIPAPESVSTTS
ncbi:winged helix-turn-helix transcriptional regulator [Paenibacillus harenae]|uniref:DNA-binding HxlR family transcriptional regulator n=1 Tax=Paenibacillus harenae TaxID=306543 RepID=A0ABT9U8E4_PAEHA|nr:helix-turn-helix domain-containing protein [Paenibacillus harenae]MDQ0115848.1 DNA-binding HxlR family transcriptional regulator [Paenibacillus harenae]